MERHPKAFISYSHSDKEIAIKISENLRKNGMKSGLTNGKFFLEILLFKKYLKKVYPVLMRLL